MHVYQRSAPAGDDHGAQGWAAQRAEHQPELDREPLAGASFEFSPAGQNTWQPLCGPTNASGVCSNATIPPGNYDVREATSPAGWTKITEAAFDGGSGDVIPPKPYIQTVTVTSGGNVTTRWFMNQKANPDIAEECGLDIALLLDRSGSIEPNVDDFRNAALAFVSSLQGTPTRLKIYSFAASASTDQGTFLNLLNPADVTTANNTITSVYNNTGGGTNWDAGFNQTIGAGVDAVIVVTDGNPTVWAGDGGSSGTVNLEDVEAGVFSANSVKNVGQKIIAVGAGNAVSPTNLQLVSGPNDFFTGSTEELLETLQDLAKEFCGGSVSVTKQEKSGNNYVPAVNNWTFTANGAGLSNVAQQTNPVSTTFDFPDGQSGSVTITESLLSGWSLHQQSGFNAVCTKNGQPLAVSNINLGVSFNLGITDIIACTFQNDPPNPGSIQVVKNTQTEAGGPFGFALSGGPTSKPPVQITTAAANTDTPFTPAPAFGGLAAGTYTVAETPPAGWTQTSASCDNTSTEPVEAVPPASITVASGDAWVCRFVNAPNTGRIRVIKKVDGQQVAGWVVNASNPAAPATITPSQVTTVASGTSDFALSKVVTGGSTTTLSEVLQDGFTAGGVTCTADGQNSQAGVAGSVTVTVKPNEVWTCTFNNTTNTGTIKVLKKVDGQQVAGWVVNASNPAAPATITPSQVTTVASGTADFALSKVVTGGSTTTLSEVLQAGFTAGGVTCTADGQNSQAGVAGSVDVTVKPSETWTCTFNNTTNTGTIKVLKKVDGQQVAGWDVNATDPSGVATITPSQVTTVASGTADFALSRW